LPLRWEGFGADPQNLLIVGDVQPSSGEDGVPLQYNITLVSGITVIPPFLPQGLSGDVLTSNGGQAEVDFYVHWTFVDSVNVAWKCPGGARCQQGIINFPPI
jgi:hypothetical protein